MECIIFNWMCLIFSFPYRNLYASSFVRNLQIYLKAIIFLEANLRGHIPVSYKWQNELSIAIHLFFGRFRKRKILKTVHFLIYYFLLTFIKWVFSDLSFFGINVVSATVVPKRVTLQSIVNQSKYEKLLYKRK